MACLGSGRSVHSMPMVTKSNFPQARDDQPAILGDCLHTFVETEGTAESLPNEGENRDVVAECQ